MLISLLVATTSQAEVIERIVAKMTGTAHTHCFDHTMRSGDSARRSEVRSREPTAIAHNDYTLLSGPQRVRDIMGDEAEALLAKPFAIGNIWRPIKPVESHPLALCDAKTLRPDALVRAERRAEDRIGELFLVRFDPEQRWI